mgnify:CR=1 FL=1
MNAIDTRIARILAGGTDLVNWMAEKIYRPDYVIDVRKLPLAGITYEEGRGLTLGAAATIEAIERSRRRTRRWVRGPKISSSVMTASFSSA